MVTYSGWTWSSEHSRYYCYSYDDQGKLLGCHWSDSGGGGGGGGASSYYNPGSRNDSSGGQQPYRHAPAVYAHAQMANDERQRISLIPSIGSSSLASQNTSPYATSSNSVTNTGQQSSMAMQIDPWTNSDTSLQHDTSLLQNPIHQYTSGYTQPGMVSSAGAPSYGSSHQPQSAASAQYPWQSEQNVSDHGRGGRIEGTYSASGGQIHYEQLDRSYYVRPASFFKRGRVFAVLWPEPAGSNVTNYNDSISEVRYSQQVRAQIRRFVVVKGKKDTCFACPIFTYSGRGTLKPGVDPREHAIAYTLGKEPTLLPGEEGIVKEPICIVPTEGEGDIDRASRIYFGIHHPIQYNVKVKDLGEVHPNQVHTLIRQWREEEEHANEPDTEVNFD